MSYIDLLSRSRRRDMSSLCSRSSSCSHKPGWHYRYSGFRQAYKRSLCKHRQHSTGLRHKSGLRRSPNRSSYTLPPCCQHNAWSRGYRSKQSRRPSGSKNRRYTVSVYSIRYKSCYRLPPCFRYIGSDPVYKHKPYRSHHHSIPYPYKSRSLASQYNCLHKLEWSYRYSAWRRRYKHKPDKPSWCCCSIASQYRTGGYPTSDSLSYIASSYDRYRSCFLEYRHRTYRYHPSSTENRYRLW